MDNDWQEARNFKLAFPPNSLTPVHFDIDARIPLSVPFSFPFGVSKEQCYSDFIRYLYDQTGSWFEEHRVHGDRIWRKLANGKTKLVMTHTNGSGEREKAKLRQSVNDAGILSVLPSFTRLCQVPGLYSFVVVPS